MNMTACDVRCSCLQVHPSKRVMMYFWHVALALLGAVQAHAAICGTSWQFPCTGNKCYNGTVWYSPGTLTILLLLVFGGCSAKTMSAPILCHCTILVPVCDGHSYEKTVALAVQSTSACHAEEILNSVAQVRMPGSAQQTFPARSCPIPSTT
jgi:hypothetical protein